MGYAERFIEQVTSIKIGESNMNVARLSWRVAMACVAGYVGFGLPATAAEQTAADQMRKEHDGRVVWTAFPGFSADIVAAQDGKSSRGTVTVDAEGKLTLKMDQTEGLEWVQRTLGSVVSHRLSDSGAITNVEYADGDTVHPLGRLIKSLDSADHSLWRVKGDMLTEVHRINDKTRMIISVSEVTRNKEGKHLPKSFTVTTWNSETGAIQSARQVFNEWLRVGSYDLPARLLGANSKADGTRVVEEIVLANHKLAEGKVKITELSPLSSPLTSFGATVAGDYLYVYGGHLGAAHDYSMELQHNKLLRLNLSQSKEAGAGQWEVVAEGPRRTGLAMVAYNNELYRIGGWEAKNKTGEEWELHSTRDFAKFDSKSGKWEELTPLPQGRSSHDAALIGSRLFVVGGWEMKGKEESEWHDTAWMCDLSHAKQEWQEIAKPGFSRRALAVAGFGGKVYAIGGMDDTGEMVTAVKVYDPQSNAWTKGPKLPGPAIEGFGLSAIGTEKGLFVTCRSGNVYQLAADAQSWQAISKLNHPRMSHRLVAATSNRLIVVGGTTRTGKVSEVESLEVRLAAAK
jgi:N-acetylneuraminic acid mutarotase